MKVMQTSFGGDIFSVQKQLHDIIKHDQQLDEAIFTDLSCMLLNFKNNSFIPVEFAEKLISGIGKLLEGTHQDKTSELCSRHAVFIDCLITLAVDFKPRIAPSQSPNVSSSSFSSHYCYELILFILLGLLDKSTLLKSFVGAVGKEKVRQLIQSISTVLCHDFLYLTQVCHWL